jgi:hypothetical protein
MAQTKKKTAIRKAPKGIRRSRAGHVLVKIREVDLEGETAKGRRRLAIRKMADVLGAPLTPGSESWRFRAQTVGAFHIAGGPTPREACDALAKLLTAVGFEANELEAFDAPTRLLLSKPYKRPGQDVGGAPQKREEAATTTFTFRLAPRLKALLVGMAELDGISPAQMAIDALEAYFADVPPRKRATRSTQ